MLDIIEKQEAVEPEFGLVFEVANQLRLVKLLKQRTTYDCWKFDEHFMRTKYWSGKHSSRRTKDSGVFC